MNTIRKRKGGDMRNRRVYSRLFADLEAVVYFNDHEYEAVIEDISENGCKLFVKDPLPDIKEQDVLELSAMDEYTLFDKEKNVVIREHLCAAWIDRRDDGVYLGCGFLGILPDTSKYVEEKKIVAYINDQKGER